MTYRAGLAITVAAFIGCAAICGGDDAAASAALPALNPLAVLGAAGLGLSLVQIHIYMAPVKRTLQVLWALGVAGAVYLAVAHPQEQVPLLVAQQPWAMWFVGPAAAAVTGVAIKEGICYGKLEAAALAALLPMLCLSHLSGLATPGAERALLAAVCASAVVFAARKASQAVQSDVGDKSVFAHIKQLEEEQRGQQQQQ